jgi:hypothetical protein
MLPAAVIMAMMTESDIVPPQKRFGGSCPATSVVKEEKRDG